MRFTFSFIFLFIFFISTLKAQEKEKEIQINFSLIHPISKAQKMEYYYGMEYSMDPALEVLYNFPVSKKVIISSGVYFQYGEHNWEELLRKTMKKPDGTWYPSRTTWTRQLRFFSVGIPLQAELKFNRFIFNSIFAGAAAGNHLYLNLKERMTNSNDNYLKAEAPDYRWYFWDVYLGIQKTIFHSPSLNLSMKPQAGYKNNRPNRIPGKSNYFYYGLGISARFEI